jgi:ATP-dependent DNA helicase RecG
MLRTDGGEDTAVKEIESLLDERRRDEAFAKLDAFGDDVAPQLELRLAELERRGGRHERAAARFERARAHVAGDAGALLQYAQVKLQLARSAKGDANFERRLALDGEARELLLSALTIDSDPRRRAYCWFEMARVLHHQRAPATRILDALRRAAELLPAEPRIRREIARHAI